MWVFHSDGQQFTVQNYDQLYVMILTAHKTTHCDMTYTVLKATLKLIQKNFFWRHKDDVVHLKANI